MQTRASLKVQNLGSLGEAYQLAKEQKEQMEEVCQSVPFLAWECPQMFPLLSVDLFRDTNLTSPTDFHSTVLSPLQSLPFQFSS